MIEEIASNYKNSLYKELATIGKGLGSDKRLELLDLLSQGPKKVENLVEETGMSFANTSRHLQILKDAKLVINNKIGNYVVYNLASSKIADLVSLLREVGEEQLYEVKKIQESFDKSSNFLYTLSLEEAYKKLQSKEILLLDIRPKDEYEAGHIKSAKNIPLSDLDRDMSELPRDSEIIIYCRGRLCAYANLASSFMNEKGYHTYSLNNSFRDWEKYNEKIQQ